MEHRYLGFKIALFLNGDLPTYIPNIYNYKKIFITDGVYDFFIKKIGITPDVISGDFDSTDINSLSLNINTKIIYTPNQNYTDFEKILSLIYKNKFLNVDIWGASGKEQDHFLGNLFTAAKYRKKLSLIFYDNYYIYFFAEKKNRINGVKNKIISLFPFPKVKGITTKGLKYSLLNESLDINRRIGIRNIAINDIIDITFSYGNLIIFVQR